MQLTAERVKEIRAKLGLTQEQLAVQLGGLHKDTVRDWERGRRPCQGPAAVLLAQMAA